MIKYIHICPDEKFINAAMLQFNEVNKQENFFIIVNDNDKLTYVDSKNCLMLRPAALYLFILKNFFSLRKKTIILHSVKKFSKIATMLLPPGCKVVWIGFGFDYYGYIKYSKFNFFKKITEFLFLKKIDFFSPVLINEYDLIRNSVPYFKPQILDWNYDVVTFYWDTILPIMEYKILIGNSATITNNHIEILTILEKLNLKCEIVVPLSYGSVDYKNEILSILESIDLETRPLLDYMDINDYYNEICSCSHVIMNHSRQQAYGNIMIALFAGCKIFLRRENPLYEYLKTSGFYIYTIDDIEQEITSKLIINEKEHNQKLAKYLYSKTRFLSRTKYFTELVKNE